MPDVFTPQKRSQVMSRIRGKGNRDTEELMVKLFRQAHIHGWRRHSKMFGRPDFVFAKARLAIFVDGCFWHCCPLHSTKPANNQEFWHNKLERNVQRDRLVTRTLRARGWRVLRVWEHELRKSRQSRCLARIRGLLESVA